MAGRLQSNECFYTVAPQGMRRERAATLAIAQVDAVRARAFDPGTPDALRTFAIDIAC